MIAVTVVTDVDMQLALKDARARLESTLSACPHCAGKVIDPKHYGMDFTGPVSLVLQPPLAGMSTWAWGVRCWNPGCGAAVLNGATAEEAVERWNRRATPEELERLRVDVARLDWLDALSNEACLEFGFEMEGGVYLRIDAPGHGGTDIREKNTARAAIDSGMIIAPGGEVPHG